MKTIIVTIFMAIGIFLPKINAQEITTYNKVEMLQKQKEEIVTAEKELLKDEVEKINEKLAKGEITVDQAQEQKEKAAKLRALNIENRIIIIDNKIALIERNGSEDIEKKDSNLGIEVKVEEPGKKKRNYKIDIEFGKDKKVKYDKRSKTNVVVAVGFNNAIVENQNFNDSEYGFGNSRFFEIGFVNTTRVFKNSNWLRARYGLSYQLNGLKLKDNQFFVQNEEEATLQVFDTDLDKSKFRLDHVVIPLHFEIGSSTVDKSEEKIRYKIDKHFKFGFGGYAGLRVGTRQKLKYKIDGEAIKDKFKKTYNTNDLTYGLSTYMGIGDVSLYAKYDLSPIFKNAVNEQNNVSLGLRFDF